MESQHDIRIEALNDDFIEQYKKMTFVNNEHDLHCAFHVLGKDLIIAKLTFDSIGFYMDDRVLTLDGCEMTVAGNVGYAYNCMFNRGKASDYLKEEITKQVEQLIADYEVKL